MSEFPEFAYISWQSKSGRSGGSSRAMRCSHEYGESHWQTQTFGEIPDHKVTEVRPLLVLDPEDLTAVRRLCAELVGYGEPAIFTDVMQDALRALADPKPPKPDEPQGLGAVVVAACVHNDRRNTWLRDHDGNWRTAVGDPDDWDSLIDPEVLSEGVS